MENETLDRLFVDHLQEAYCAERQVLDTLPQWIPAVATARLREALQEKLEDARRHLEGLEEIFPGLRHAAAGSSGREMAMLLETGTRALTGSEPAVIDSGLLGAAQQIESYELSTFAVLRELAEQKGDERTAGLSREILEDENRIDRRLASVAEWLLDIRAA